ncbi:MAG: hypothetical protein C4527_16950 [Candidatus Omnitrophota bacterium]|jgi:hypothetical protein|nr:MAG: hypothetical protein C4527_16950 [Candidatus Omnitrophota bacterium]
MNGYHRRDERNMTMNIGKVRQDKRSSVVFFIVAVMLLISVLPCRAENNGETAIKSETEGLSFTVYPILAGDQWRNDVGEVVATFLERGGVQNLEIPEVSFQPASDMDWDQTIQEFGKFIQNQSIKTQYALYGEFVGTRQSGVQEVRTVVVDAKGSLIWNDRQTPKDAEFKQVNPRNPMTCCVLMAKRLQTRFSLDDPLRENAPEGKMAERWREKSGAPTEEEKQSLEKRLALLKKNHEAASITIYPVRIGSKTDREHAETLGKTINEKKLMKAQLAENDVILNIPGNSNETKVLWDMARAFREELRKNPPKTQYALYADYIMQLPTGPVRGVHFVICDNNGEWVMVDLQNEYQTEFKTINPKTVDDCNRIIIECLENRIDLGE